MWSKLFLGGERRDRIYISQERVFQRTNLNLCKCFMRQKITWNILLHVTNVEKTLRMWTHFKIITVLITQIPELEWLLDFVWLNHLEDWLSVPTKPNKEEKKVFGDKILCYRFLLKNQVSNLETSLQEVTFFLIISWVLFKKRKKKLLCYEIILMLLIFFKQYVI